MQSFELGLYYTLMEVTTPKITSIDPKDPLEQSIWRDLVEQSCTPAISQAIVPKVLLYSGSILNYGR